ncbi:CaiB/BaiF CoA transferase family protein [Blastococcus mobilis]|uniref:Crotonobetainyl-CoA:carnitine CoA-transferase CaiB n=1 Tax=Blastococcus mobilis TaxID=1938746 RepID=A0A238X3U0_9ACTN|nr:CaiB/BaiF CoA-transferase family protein [Blastococcus mobilis]SNR53656.1 Crotonobetainyl-CoA:carnitine CoA-transferase CaiB [Blastococcus mobilis]
MTGTDTGGRGPLSGIVVLSLAEQYPGPYATLLMADMGADVILVERPAGGDPARQFPAFHEALNRNKRSVTLDLKSSEGREALVRLARTADVLLEGYRPGTMGRLGLGPDVLHEANPRLVIASISGFGQDGPYRDRPAHDLSYLATAGMLHEYVSGDRTGPVGQLAIGDLASAMFATVGVLAALLQRATTGSGAHVDVSMTDGLVSWMSTQLVPVLNGEPLAGIEHEPGYGLYRTSDGLITLSVAHEDWFWRPLCDVLGMQDVAALTGPERIAREDELRERIGTELATRTRDEWVAVLDAAGVPVGPVHTLEEVGDDPHVRARGLLVDIPADGVRPRRQHVRQPLLFDGVAPAPTRHVPALGEHTEEVLAAVAEEVAGAHGPGTPDGALRPVAGS